MSLFSLFIIAVIAYVMAFKAYRRYLLVKFTPTFKITALSPGTVAVEGTVHSDNPLVLPNGEEAVAYIIKYYHGRSPTIEYGIAPFNIEDETGKVFVNMYHKYDKSARSMALHAKVIDMNENWKSFIKKRGLALPRMIYVGYIPNNSRAYILGEYVHDNITMPKFKNIFKRFKDAVYARIRLLLETQYVFAKNVEKQEEMPQIRYDELLIISRKRSQILVMDKLFLIISFLMAPPMIALYLWGIVNGYNILPFFPVVPGICAILWAMPILMYLLGIYNNLVMLREQTEKFKHNIDAVLKLRKDLITNLKKVVKSYAKHEKNIMESIANNRITEKDFMIIAEKYPQLKADEMFEDLMNTLRDIEERIAKQREVYNESVRIYNTHLEKFPYLIVAKAFIFKKADLIALS